MADNHDKDGEPRTVFQPAGGPAPAPEPPRPSAPAPPTSEPGAPADTAAEDAWFSGDTPAQDAPGFQAEEARTVFAPSPASWDQVAASTPTPQAFNPTPSGFEPPAGPPAFQPTPAPVQWSAPPPPQQQPPSQPPPPQAPTGFNQTTSFPGAGPGGAPGRVVVGTVLNNTYQVQRFIARGGMGEVFEGVELGTEGRVAIKVIVPHMAQDPNVLEMLRKEARALSRLHHPNVVQYRGMSQDASLGAWYVVTEYIDGRQLEDVLGQLKPTAEELRLFTRKLCEGLKAAHDLGTFHRDMSPDNVLLPDGRLDRAKVIDFGIAKDADPSNRTIVGDGFAGKMGFVAPEQFGDYGREIGPWTDIYSTALTVMALAAGRPIDMGATLVDAIDKRRMGPDLTVLPESLRPVFAGMLQPDPAKRFRSMAEVIAALDGSMTALPPSGDSLEAIKKAPPLKPAKVEKPAKPAAAATARPAKGPPLALIGGGIGAAVLIGVLAVVFWPRGGETPAPADPGETPVAAGGEATTAPTGGAAGDPEQVRQAVVAALPTIACSWLDVQRADRAQGGVELKLVGAARNAAEAQNAVIQAARGVTSGPVNVDMADVTAVPASACEPLNAFQQIRAPAGTEGLKFTTFQPVYEISQGGVGECGPGQARSEFRMNVGAPSSDFTIVGVEPSGGLQQPLHSRAEFDGVRQSVPSFAVDLGGDSFRLGLCADAKSTGTNGMLLLQGRGPFDMGLPGADQPAAVKDAAWAQRFVQQAKAKGWTASMVWYRVADQIPG